MVTSDGGDGGGGDGLRYLIEITIIIIYQTNLVAGEKLFDCRHPTSHPTLSTVTANLITV